MTRHTNGPFRLDEQTSYKRVDLINCSPHQFCEVLALAAKIGVTDAMIENKPRTTKQIAEMLCLEHRVGHARALKQAYSAGRFHVDMMGKG